MKKGSLTRPSAASFTSASASAVQQELLSGLSGSPISNYGVTASQAGSTALPPEAGSSLPLSQLEGAVHVYQVAFNELRKQVWHPSKL